MKESIYKSYEELPLFLNAETVAKVLGVAPSTVYELMHEADFPEAAKELMELHQCTVRKMELYCCPKGTVHCLGAAAYRRRDSVKHQKWSKRDPIKTFFQYPMKCSYSVCHRGTSSVFLPTFLRGQKYLSVLA